jgi:hypothetical protein
LGRAGGVAWPLFLFTAIPGVSLLRKKSDLTGSDVFKFQATTKRAESFDEVLSFTSVHTLQVEEE